MTRPTNSRKRILRVRTVEQRLAQMELAQAQRSAQQICSIVDRIDALGRENGIGSGLADGRTLAAKSEMKMRLEQARQLTAEPMENAQRQVDHRQLQSNRAQQKVDGANRLLEKSERKNAASAMQRADATRCSWNPRKPGETP